MRRRVAPGLYGPRDGSARQASQGAPVSNQTIEELIRTVHYDLAIVQEMAGTLDRYGKLPVRTMLLRGTKSQPYLRDAVDALEKVIPDVDRVVFEGLGHLGSADDGRPEVVAVALKRFF